jgi:hypothetical protein
MRYGRRGKREREAGKRHRRVRTWEYGMEANSSWLKLGANHSRRNLHNYLAVRGRRRNAGKNARMRDERHRLGSNPSANLQIQKLDWKGKYETLI